MKTYFASRYRDSFDVMAEALEDIGLQRVTKPTLADIVFIDREPTANDKKWQALDDLARQKPVFIYPHTPYAFWLWDGYTKPSPHIACNFVTCQAAVLSMREYGYPCPVEVVGFTRPLTVRPFTPTSGKHLAYSSIRLIGADGQWPYPGDCLMQERTMNWIVENRRSFERITIFYSFDLDTYRLRPYEQYDFDFVCVAKDSVETKAMNTAHALKQLQGIDLFIGSHTLGYIALSQGIPTVLVGHDTDYPMFAETYGWHYQDYAKYCGFPLNLQEMSAAEVLELCKNQNSTVEFWKQMNIGTSFKKDKFLDVVREYL